MWHTDIEYDRTKASFHQIQTHISPPHYSAILQRYMYTSATKLFLLWLNQPISRLAHQIKKQILKSDSILRSYKGGDVCLSSAYQSRSFSSSSSPTVSLPCRLINQSVRLTVHRATRSHSNETFCDATCLSFHRSAASVTCQRSILNLLSDRSRLGWIAYDAARTTSVGSYELNFYLGLSLIFSLCGFVGAPGD